MWRLLTLKEYGIISLDRKRKKTSYGYIKFYGVESAHRIKLVMTGRVKNKQLHNKQIREIFDKLMIEINKNYELEDLSTTYPSGRTSIFRKKSIIQKGKY